MATSKKHCKPYSPVIFDKLRGNPTAKKSGHQSAFFILQVQQMRCLG